MQTLDAVGILIRGLVYDSQFIFSRFQHLSLSELRDRLALLGPDAKYDIVFGYINHNGPADPLSVEELLGRLHYEYNLNK